MAKITVQGTITYLSEIESGISKKGNEWLKRDLIVEEPDGRYTNEVAFTAFNKSVEKFNDLNIGDEISIDGWVISKLIKNTNSNKEYLQTSIDVLNVTVLRSNIQTQGYSQPQQQAYQQQAYQQQTQSIYPQGGSIQPTHSSMAPIDDLPFNNLPGVF